VERKVATVLFADLVDSTELGEQDPARTRAMRELLDEVVAGFEAMRMPWHAERTRTLL